MNIYDSLRTPPTDALKKIEAGRLKGKSDISPQWRYEAMTRQFGPCGIGWKYEITKMWTEQGSADQVMCFANVNLFIRVDGQWSDAIPGTGGSMLVTKEASGLHSSDEGFKMATTDALSVAMKMIGVAADIYRGVFDTKYQKEQPKEQPKGPEMASENQRKAIYAITTKLGWSNDDAKAEMKKLFNIDSSKDLSLEQAKQFLSMLRELEKEKDAKTEEKINELGKDVSNA